MPDTAEHPLKATAPELAAHIERVQARHGTVALWTGAAMALIGVLVWLAAGMTLDWIIALPTWARAIFLVLGCSGALGSLWWFGIRPCLNKPDDERAALAIERAVPEFRTRFIASVQLARHSDSPSRSLVRALINDTSAFAGTVSLRGVVKTDMLRRWLIAAGCSVLLAAALWIAGGHASWPLLQRALLVGVPVPRNTQITGFTGHCVIALGDDLRIEANAAGVVPAAGVLKIKTAKGTEQKFTLDADPLNAAHFYRTLQSVQDGFSYSIELGDNETEIANVRVRPRPTILKLDAEQRWPEYTKREPQPRATGDLKLLAGSKLALTMKPSAVLREAQILLTGGANRQPVKIEAMRPAAVMPGEIAEWSGVVEIPVDGISGLTFQLVDEEGVASKGMATYRIDIVPDEPPNVQVLWPERREELVTNRATLLIAFEAKDDFGIDRVKLHFGVNWDESLPFRTIDLDLAGQTPKSLTRRFEWNLERIQPPLREGDVVDYWFEAIDTNNVTGPGKFELPEHYQARVVSEQDKRADLANRLSDTLQGLNDVKTGQEDLAKRLGELIREKAADK